MIRQCEDARAEAERALAQSRLVDLPVVSALVMTLRARAEPGLGLEGEEQATVSPVRGLAVVERFELAQVPEKKRAVLVVARFQPPEQTLQASRQRLAQQRQRWSVRSGSFH